MVESPPFQTDDDETKWRKWMMTICDLHLDIALRDVVKIAKLIAKSLDEKSSDEWIDPNSTGIEAMIQLENRVAELEESLDRIVRYDLTKMRSGINVAVMQGIAREALYGLD